MTRRAALIDDRMLIQIRGELIEESGVHNNHEYTAFGRWKQSGAQVIERRMICWQTNELLRLNWPQSAGHFIEPAKISVAGQHNGMPVDDR